MEKQLSQSNFKDASMQDFKLPEDFSVRLQELEISLYEGTLTHYKLKDLFELYSVNN
jgi:hypothetical protein